MKLNAQNALLKHAARIINTLPIPSATTAVISVTPAVSAFLLDVWFVERMKPLILTVNAANAATCLEVVV